MTRKNINKALRSALYKYAAPTAGLSTPATPSLVTSGGSAPKGLPPMPKPAAPAIAALGPAAPPTVNKNPFGGPTALANKNPFGAAPVTPTKHAPTPASTPGYSRAPSGFLDAWMNPPKPAANSGAPTNSPYLNTLDRWYNRNTAQQVTEKGETGLMRAGQAGLALAAGSGAGLATAAAPIAAFGTGVNTAIAGGTALATTRDVLGAMPNRVPTPEQPVAPAAPQAYDGRPQAVRDANPSGLPVHPDAAQQPQEQQPAQQQPEQPAAQMPQQAQQQTQQAPPAPAAMDIKAQDALVESTKNLPPEQAKAKVQEGVQAHVSALPPEEQKGIKDVATGNADTPEAKQFKEKVEGPVKDQYVKDEYAKQTANNPNVSPQQAGGILNGIMEGWNNMPNEMKWMMGIGLGGGLLGLISSMFGGGGGGMGLLGLLGLGAAGIAGAAGGMFGGAAQNFMADTIGSIGKSMGMMPEKLTDQQKQILLAKDPVAHITGSGKVPTRADAAKQVAAARKQLGQLQTLNSMGGMTPRMLEGMGLSPEEAQIAAKNVGTLSGQYADSGSALNKYLQRGEEYSKPTWTSWGQELGSYMLGKRGCDLARRWAKEAEDKDIKEWLRKYRARGQKGRWVNTQRSAKMEKRVKCSN